MNRGKSRPRAPAADPAFLRLLKTGLGLVLVPVTITGALALWDVALAARAHIAWPAAWFWFLGGFVIWLLLFYALPQPTRTYILGHELTHALWSSLLGGRVGRLRVTRAGGSVEVSETGAWVTLAPYFFPFYTFCALIAYLILSLWLPTQAYTRFWAGLFGLTWAFHFCFTAAALRIGQPDIREQGRLFSYSFILFMNGLLITAWLTLCVPLPARALLAAWLRRLAQLIALGLP
ncbi:MAG: hypothetical protein K9N49_02110 [Candidatus Marinimicrobia bacterium]|nr:hypothetical protein [Candidatus Neomarinimicrobiota bacterium]